jgi:hypothetical protein
MFIVVDIDHTLSNAFWRDNKIGVVPWDEYYSEGKHDKPFPKMKTLINALTKNGDLVIAITGRPEKFRGLTIDWLIKNDILVHDLIMRPDNVFLKNWEMKVKLLTTYFNNSFDTIGFIIDDNEETILKFNELGISTLQVRNIP